MPTAYQYSTGAVHSFVLASPKALGYNGLSTSTNGSGALYLGTCEQYPLVRGGNNWNPFFMDLTGTMEPFDEEYEGSWKLIALDLNKVIQSSVSLITDSNGSIKGNSQLGNLLQGGGNSLMLWLKFSNWATPVAAPGLPVGEFYPCCKVVGYTYARLGTVDRLTSLIFRTKPLVNLGTNPAPNGYGSTITWSTDPKYFVGLPPIA